MRRLALFILFFLVGHLYAGENFLISTSSTELKTALTDLYSMDFDQANQDFAKIVSANPNDPFAYLSEAGALWWETSAQNGIIPSPDWLRQRFKNDLNLAIKGARRLLASSSRADRAEGHFIIGLSLGELGEWDFIHHHWFKAFLNGRKALSHLKACVRLDSTYYDAYLGLGSYDYQVSRFGFLLKAGAFLGGLHANERRGIEHLIIAEDRGPYSRDQAAIFLATLYLADKMSFRPIGSARTDQQAPGAFNREIEIVFKALSEPIGRRNNTVLSGCFPPQGSSFGQIGERIVGVGRNDFGEILIRLIKIHAVKIGQGGLKLGRGSRN